MHYSTLGHSGIKVSRVCLGSMTWGLQNNQQDADQQIDYAIERGVNFIDTAEMYAIPPSADTYGRTETIIGNWLAEHPGKRDSLVVATKIAGEGLAWVRDGGPITGDAVVTAVDQSLARLQTDYIDVYQLHWPNHPFAQFGRHWPNDVCFSKTDANQAVESMHDILNGLARCVDAGKIRFCGLSDDSPWGINKYLELALKWCDQVDGVTSTIIGATTLEQLREDLDAFEIDYSEGLADEVSKVLKRHALPF